MITINLLPPEYRRRERTPARIFAATVGGIFLATSAVAYAAYARFGLLSRTRAERAVVEEELAGLKPSIAYHDALVAEHAESEKRLATIREIRTSRVHWTRRLDELSDVVNQASDADRYLVWFDEIAIDQRTEGKSGGKLTAKAFSGSDNFANVAAFFQDVETHEFFKDFEKQINPEGKRSEKDDKLIPPQVWEFPLEMSLKKREPPKPAKATAAKRPKEPANGSAAAGEEKHDR